MTEQIDRERLWDLASEHAAAGDRETARAIRDLLYAWAKATDRATRAEAQSAIRGRAVAVYQQRAREAEAERDEWREASVKLAASSNQANADLYEAETPPGKH